MDAASGAYRDVFTAILPGQTASNHSPIAKNFARYNGDRKVRAVHYGRGARCEGKTVLVAGVDEVGRGCLAGPVYAAAVILPKPCRLPGLDDSKKLPREERERLAPLIQQRALAFAIASASVEEIDRINILQASLLAMQRAVAMLALKPVLCLVDGNQPPRLDCEVQTVIGGDGRHRCIMAASVLAKVARDAELRRLDETFPGYGFAQHKGYATPEHGLALRRLGPCGIHRMSFAPCAQGSFAFDELVPDDEAFDPGELGLAASG